MVKPPGAHEPLAAAAGVTDVGRQRKHNEDTILVRADLDLFCVADGMGGHNAGDVASKLTVTSIANYFEATRGGAAGAEEELSEDYADLPPAARRLAAAVSKANRDVFTISNTVHQHHGMGSTCVAIHLADGTVSVAHVGDSRCYRIRDGEIVQLTRDHSLINDALEMKPDLTKEELARLPKNIITRALGMKDAVKVDVKSEPIVAGDVFLLCSDGLTGMVPVEQILEVLELTPDLNEACELLVAEANDHGGTDNISALVVRALSEEDRAAARVAAALVPEDEEVTRPAPAVAPKIAAAAAPSGPSAPSAPSAPPPAAPPPPPSVPRAAPSVRSIVPPTPPVPVAPVRGIVAPAPQPRPSSPSMPLASEEPRPVAGPQAHPASSPPASRPSVRAPILEIVDDDTEEAGPFAPAVDGDTDASSYAGAVTIADEETADLMLLGVEEEKALFDANASSELDLRGAWSSDDRVQRCRRCLFELLPGNAFCVECGLRIEEEEPTNAGSTG